MAGRTSIKLRKFKIYLRSCADLIFCHQLEPPENLRGVDHVYHKLNYSFKFAASYRNHVT